MEKIKVTINSDLPIPKEGVPHAILRAKEHYGLDLKIDDLHEMIRLINAGESIVTSISETGVRHLVKCQGRVLPVIYSPVGNAILTVLPACRRKPQEKAKNLNRRKHRDRSSSQMDEDSLGQHGNLAKVYDYFMNMKSVN